MPNYRRAYAPGGCWFFTVVTAHRRPILTSNTAIDVLRESVRDVLRTRPFRIDAWVILPDHMHAIWTLPDADFSRRWGCIKAAFTRRCGLPRVSAHGSPAGIWQPRFWEHLIRDEQDFARHMDYVHYNPVKHGHARRVADWPWSSFHRCARRGIYRADWGQAEPVMPSIDVGE